MSPQTKPIGISPKFYNDFANRPRQNRHNISPNDGNAAIFSGNMQKKIQLKVKTAQFLVIQNVRIGGSM